MVRLHTSVFVALAIALAPQIPARAQNPQNPEVSCADIADDAFDALREAGETAWKRGDFAEAATCWIAEAGALASADPKGELDAYLRGGQALRTSGNLVGARRAFEIAVARAHALNDTRGGLEANTGLGSTHLAAGALEFAERAFDEALRDARETSNSALIAQIQNERGNLMSRTGRGSEAIAAYREAEKEARAAGDTALALRCVANALRAEVEEPSASGLIVRVKAVAAELEPLPDDEAKAHLLIHLGRTTQQLADRQSKGRAENRRQAALLYLAASRAAAAAGAHRSESFALGYLAQLNETDGRLDEARTLIQRAIFAAQIAESPDPLYRWQRASGRIEHAKGRSDAALASYRQAVQSLSQLRVKAAAGGGSGAAAFLSAAKPVYDEFVDLLLVQARAAEDSATLQALLSESRDTLEALGAAELRDYFGDECVDAQRQAKIETIPGAVVIYPIVLADRVEIIVGDTSGLRSVVTRVDRERFDAQVHEFRRLLAKRTTEEYRRPGMKLYEWLITPLEKSLGDSHVDALVFVPRGSLRTIPMGALVDPQSGKFLIEKYPIAVTPGLTLTEPKRIDRTNVVLLTAGLAVGRQGFQALPYVADEVRASHKVFEGESLMDQDFVTSSLAQQLEQTQYGIVHIASHGEFGSSIEESFVLTFDDRLSVGDLGQLVDMARFRRQPVELLTLSACETAAGDERAALGLAGLAIRSGARSALASLWKVNDQAAAELIGEFYRQLALPESSRARALQAAQLKVLRQAGYQHPGYWSPFLLIGSWL